jgi:hypothetical protein
LVLACSPMVTPFAIAPIVENPRGLWWLIELQLVCHPPLAAMG